jgi:hypothetical protein
MVLYASGTAVSCSPVEPSKKPNSTSKTTSSSVSSTLAVTSAPSSSSSSSSSLSKKDRASSKNTSSTSSASSDKEKAHRRERSGDRVSSSTREKKESKKERKRSKKSKRKTEKVDEPSACLLCHVPFDPENGGSFFGVYVERVCVCVFFFVFSPSSSSSSSSCSVLFFLSFFLLSLSRFPFSCFSLSFIRHSRLACFHFVACVCVFLFCFFSVAPYPVQVHRCQVCQSGYVPEVFLSTGEYVGQVGVLFSLSLCSVCVMYSSSFSVHTCSLSLSLSLLNC